MAKKEDPELITRYADMLSAMGTEPRLRIVRLLLSAHPEGMVVGEVGEELGIPSSTLSHHLEKLKNEDLVRVRRDGTFLWYSANTEAVNRFLGRRFSYVVTLCDREKEKTCPIFPGAIWRLQWDLEDFSQTRPREERGAALRRVRDDIQERVIEFLNKAGESRKGAT